MRERSLLNILRKRDSIHERVYKIERERERERERAYVMEFVRLGERGMRYDVCVLSPFSIVSHLICFEPSSSATRSSSLGPR